MGKLTFRGGIHPYEGKELSKDHPIEKYLPKGDLVYPLSQHIGAPSVPCVKKGDTVLAGQKIADAGGFVSVPLHASVSGTVKGIEKRLNATGSMVECIVIENDPPFKQECQPLPPYKRRNPKPYQRGWGSRYGWSRISNPCKTCAKGSFQD